LSSIKNICIIASSLGGGGAERVASQQSKMLQDLGFKVCVITILNNVTYPVSGKLLNLGLEIGGKDSIIAKFNRHFKIKRFLNDNNVDVIIDHRVRSSVLNELLYSFFTYSGKSVMYYVHSYVIKNYIPSDTFFSKKVFKRANKIIAVSKEIELHVKNTFGFENIKTIYNPIEINDEKLTQLESYQSKFEYVLFYGRIVDEVKNLKLLINAYHKSILKENGIKLLIVGDGKDRNMLIEMANGLNLSEMILFKPFTQSPFTVVKQAKFTVLTSKYEGFPMTMLESLSCGVPVVSVDCKSGPNEIIRDKFNGLLVENNNAEALAEAMNSFVLNAKLYNICKKNAKESISKFNVETISKEWLNILK